MKLTHCIWLVVVLVTVLYQVKAEEEKAEKKKKLQIGVKKRVDPEQCKIKSRKGDTLNMHYTVSVETYENYYLIYCQYHRRLVRPTVNKFQSTLKGDEKI